MKETRSKTTLVKKSTGLALVLVCLTFFPLSSGYADCPPDCSSHEFSISRMSLAFDAATKLLHIEADHHSRDRYNQEVDYVGKLTISLNGKQIIVLHFKHQVDPDEFLFDVMVKAKAGDVISVVLYTKVGGTKSLDLTVSNELISEIQSVDTQSSQSIN